MSDREYSPVFRITLRDVDGHEDIAVRQFDLRLGATFPVGRSSRNAAKPDLMPAAHNAYINSPVISRDHAIVSASADSGIPCVYIKDVGSMHGTMVNGQRLEPNTPQQLFTGDLLQFGIDVNRNEEFYVARKYIAEAHLIRPGSSFSMGFTVPDSDDEDAVITSPRRGSEDNPLTIDDSDEDSNSSNYGENGPPVATHSLINPYERPTVPIETPSSHGQHKESAIRTTVFEEHYSDGEDDLTSYQAADYSPTSITRSSPHDDSDLEDDHSGMGQEEASTNAGDGSVADSVSDEVLSGSKHFQGNFTPYPVLTPFKSDISFGAIQSIAESDLPPISTLRDASNDMFSDSIPPPLPPRPSDCRPQPVNTIQTDIRPGEPPSNPRWTEYISNEWGCSLYPSMAPTHNADVEAAAAFVFGDGPLVIASHIQTTPPVPASEKLLATPPPPNRRTKVSITEIVDEQPPTPEPLHSMKRKADVLEEDVVVAQKLVSAPVEASADADASVSTVAADAAAIIAQRPKKQPRSVMRKLKQTAAILSYGAAGAVGALAVLSNLPDAFFT